MESEGKKETPFREVEKGIAASRWSTQPRLQVEQRSWFAFGRSHVGCKRRETISAMPT